MVPILSVIIPVYNAQDTLEQCLDSVLTQSLQLIEVICVNDGSTDQSLSILKEYARRDTRVNVLTQKKQYAGVARNRGIAIARGEYLAFLDADDTFLPDALKKLYVMVKRYDVDMVKGGFLYVDAESGRRFRSPEGTNSSIHWWERSRVLEFSRKPWQLLYVADVPWNGLYRRKFLQENSIRFNSLICVNDHSFYIACLIWAKRIMVTNTPVVCYRISQSQSLVGRKAENFDAQLASFEIVQELSKKVPFELSHIIMQHELNSLFGWYQRLRPQARDPRSLNARLSEFLQTFDEATVGAPFLRSRPYWETYWTLRYGTPAPARKKPCPIQRAWRCWLEHGLFYIWARIKMKLGGHL